MRHYLTSTQIREFVLHSNAIEGIQSTSGGELEATLEFLQKEIVYIEDLTKLVSVYAPGNVLHDRPGLNVRVGSYHAPPGGPQIAERLEKILFEPPHPSLDPVQQVWEIHVAYEMLHPFTDGNGRSCRALWAW